MIIDNYILVRYIGKGVFSEVFLSQMKGDNSKKFATKKLERSFIEKSEAIKYLKNEVLILKKLNHPNIVKIESIKKTKKHFYIIMEFCNGGKLSDALEKYQRKYEKPFSQEIVQHLMRQIIDVFRYIHSQNIIHRNISSDNILLNFETEKDKEDLNMMKATIKIIGFGFACYIKSDLLYSIIGSPLNMDPLILKKLVSDSRKTKQLGYNQKADVWSLGTICYEMLIGRSAFDLESLDELVEKVERGIYTIPTDLSKETISFINGMMQYESNKRLTCEELYKHPFLINKVEDFHQIDKLKCADMWEHSYLRMIHKLKKSIWSIFNSENEIKLMSINGKDYNKNEENNNGLQLPKSGIPGNPIDQQIQNSGTDNITPSFGGGIFDDN